MNLSGGFCGGWERTEQGNKLVAPQNDVSSLYVYLRASWKYFNTYLGRLHSVALAKTQFVAFAITL